MKTATLRDLRYHFSEIEARLHKRGEEIEIRKRQRVIARLVPVRPKPEAYPDFGARAREIFGDRITELTGTQIVSEGRDRY
jgi:antitoxin (DNA-binding transcriptional repressor) of toxin-antitoxin stability system